MSATRFQTLRVDRYQVDLLVGLVVLSISLGLWSFVNLVLSLFGYDEPTYLKFFRKSFLMHQPPNLLAQYDLKAKEVQLESRPAGVI